MTRYISLLVAISLYNTVCHATCNCEEKVTDSYLNVAVDMIEKARYSVPKCVSSGNILTKKASGNILTKKASDCSEIFQMGNKKSGVYTVWPNNRLTSGTSLEVYCDMETVGGGWTLIQRRGNFHRPNDYFYKDWKSYKEGFGDIVMDFWLGNDNIIALSNQKNYSVRFDLTDVENNTAYAQYDSFWIDDESHKYKLHIEGYSGDAGDSITGEYDISGQKFSTNDQDNDSNKNGNCSHLYKGAWWYSSCHYSNLNGQYLRGKHESFADGVNWGTWKGFKESLEATEIKIRPKNFELAVSLNTLML